MTANIAEVGIMLGTIILFAGFFIRIEHRFTRLETLVEMLLKKAGICLPNSDENMQ